MNRHINNLRRAAGLGTISNSNNRYEYITNTDELTRAFMESKADLAYSLRKEAKRDRYILNKAALQEDISKTVTKTLLDNIDLLTQYAAAGIVSEVNAALGGTAAGTKNNRNSLASMLGNKIGKAIVEIPFKFMDEIWNDANSDD